MQLKVTPLYLAATFRILANVEAVNAIEPLGNVIRHRKASIAVPRTGSISIITVPTASGEAIRHAYQYTLAQLAALQGIAVCSWCRRGEFVKHGVLVHDLYPAEEKELIDTLTSDRPPEDKEFEVVKRCVVEDIAGFLTPAARKPAKRTSRIQVSYLVPSMIEVARGAFAVDTQFHVRHAPQAEAKAPEGVQPRPQSIYYVESASAVYTFSAVIDLGGIGIVVKSDGSVESLDPKERLTRSLLAVQALAEIVKSGGIGGKQSSYMPHWMPLSGVVVVSKPVKFVPVPPHVESYVSDTLNNVKSQISALESIGLKGVKVNIAVFKSQIEVDAVKNDIESAGVEDKYKQVIALQKFTSVAEAFKWVLEVVKEELSKGLGASQGL